MKKRIFTTVLCLLMVLAIFTACTADTTNTAGTNEIANNSNDDGKAPKEESNESSKSDMKISVVLHALNSSFYARIQEGAEKAGEDLGIKVDVVAPNTANNLAEQVSLLETSISSGYDGIATVVWDPEGFTDVINKAHDAGIPVVSLNQNSGKDDGVPFIGQDLEESGYMLGKYMFEEVMKGEGKFAICSCAPEDSALIAREQGIKRAAEEYPNIEFVELLNITTDLTTAVGVIENAYLANPDIDAFLGVDVFSEAIGTFIESNQLHGEVYGAGFDLTEGTLQHIKNNAMQLTVGQNPFLQGYYSVVQLYQHLKHGYDLLDMNTGAFLVTQDNVDMVEPE